ncbi:C39 family peptidase [Deinococcus sp.]|uniref:C39 family peptidase n=1 Tax=Deinococcus sp. TaxID=47478 RepID=UPI003B5957A9
MIAIRSAALGLSLLGSAWAVAPASTQLSGIRHEYQRLNNCGPVTIGMAMSYWGSTQTQYQIAPQLKDDANDKSVNFNELKPYAEAQGYFVHQGVNGDLPLLKSLIASGFPVMVETWFVTQDDGGMGHYRLLSGYDDAKGMFRALDSYLGPNLSLKYAELDRLWRAYDRSYMVVVPKNKASNLQGILGAQNQGKAMWRGALKTAQAEAKSRGDAFAYLNLGSAKLKLGDARGAARAFDLAQKARPDPSLDPTRPASVTGGWPWRTLWYRFEPLEAYLRVGRNADVQRLTTATLRYTPGHKELLAWQRRSR